MGSGLERKIGKDHLRGIASPQSRYLPATAVDPHLWSKLAGIRASRQLFEWRLIYAEKCLQLYTLVRRDIAETRPARETKIPMHYFSCFPFCFVDN